MMNKTKISNNQLFTLIANFSIGTTVITVSSGVISLAKQDAWLSVLIAAVGGIPFIWMYFYLGKLYPGKTIIEIINLLLGKWIGWIVSLAFVFFVCLIDTASVMAYIGNFMQTEYMTETPLYAFNLILAICLVIGLLYGLESIARSSEFFLYMITVLFLLAMMMDIPNINVENLMPVMEKGFIPILKGALFLSSYMTWPLISLNMIYPSCVNNPSESYRYMIGGYVFGSAFSFISNIMSVLVLGSNVASKSLYPTYLIAKEISFGVISRLEAIVSFVWIVSEFIKTILYFYAGVVGLSQILGLKDYKKIVIPLGLVVLMFSGVIYPDIAYQTQWDGPTWVAFIFSFGAVLPAILLIISGFKNKMKPEKGA